MSSEHRQDFHVVRLNGFIHTDDKLALKEIWRQLGREMDAEEDFAGKVWPLSKSSQDVFTNCLVEQLC